MVVPDVMTNPRNVFLTVTMLVFLAVFSLAAIFTFMLPKTYMSVSRVRLAGLRGDAAAALTSEAELAKSDGLLNAVAQGLNLNVIWGKKIRMDGELKTWESVTLLKRQLEVLATPGAKELEIRIYDDDSSEAARIANRVAEVLCATPTHANDFRAELVSSAQSSERAVRPNIPLNLFLGAIVGLSLGVPIGGASVWVARAMNKPVQNVPAAA